MSVFAFLQIGAEIVSECCRMPRSKTCR